MVSTTWGHRCVYSVAIASKALCEKSFFVVIVVVCALTFLCRFRCVRNNFLTQRLTCDGHGIYATQCKLCHQITLDKLKTNFQLNGLITVRFGKVITHKTTLIKLLFYFISIITTKNFITFQPDISECYHVIFLHEPSNYHNLYISESKWINKLKATVNMNRTLSPKFF